MDFSESVFEKKLLLLKDSADVIQKASAYCMANKKEYKKIIHCWSKCVKKAKIAQRLSMFYLANDVIQACKRKNYRDIVDYWAIYIKQAVYLVTSHKVRDRMLRIFKVWESRMIYDEKYMKELNEILTLRSNEEDRQKIMAEFQPRSLFEKIRNVILVQMDVEKKYRELESLKYDSLKIEQFQRGIKDRREGDDLVTEFEEYVRATEGYVEALEKELEERNKLIKLLDKAYVFYDGQKGEVKVVLNAYKNYAGQVKSLKKKLDALLPTIKDMSPFPSPDVNAPSPSPDHDLPLPTDEVTDPVKNEEQELGTESFLNTDLQSIITQLISAGDPQGVEASLSEIVQNLSQWQGGSESEQTSQIQGGSESDPNAKRQESTESEKKPSHWHGNSETEQNSQWKSDSDPEIIIDEKSPEPIEEKEEPVAEKGMIPGLGEPVSAMSVVALLSHVSPIRNEPPAKESNPEREFQPSIVGTKLPSHFPTWDSPPHKPVMPPDNDKWNSFEDKKRKSEEYSYGKGLHSNSDMYSTSPYEKEANRKSEAYSLSEYEKELNNKRDTFSIDPYEKEVHNKSDVYPIIPYEKQMHNKSDVYPISSYEKEMHKSDIYSTSPYENDIHNKSDMYSISPYEKDTHVKSEVYPVSPYEKEIHNKSDIYSINHYEKEVDSKSEVYPIDTYEKEVNSKSEVFSISAYPSVYQTAEPDDMNYEPSDDSKGESETDVDHRNLISLTDTDHRVSSTYPSWSEDQPSTELYKGDFDQRLIPVVQGSNQGQDSYEDFEEDEDFRNDFRLKPPPFFSKVQDSVEFPLPFSQSNEANFLNRPPPPVETAQNKNNLKVVNVDMELSDSDEEQFPTDISIPPPPFPPPPTSFVSTGAIMPPPPLPSLPPLDDIPPPPQPPLPPSPLQQSPTTLQQPPPLSHHQPPLPCQPPSLPHQLPTLPLQQPPLPHQQTPLPHQPPQLSHQPPPLLPHQQTPLSLLPHQQLQPLHQQLPPSLQGPPPPLQQPPPPLPPSPLQQPPPQQIQVLRTPKVKFTMRTASRVGDGASIFSEEPKSELGISKHDLNSSNFLGTLKEITLVNESPPRSPVEKETSEDDVTEEVEQEEEENQQEEVDQLEHVDQQGQVDQEGQVDQQEQVDDQEQDEQVRVNQDEEEYVDQEERVNQPEQQEQQKEQPLPINDLGSDLNPDIPPEVISFLNSGDLTDALQIENQKLTEESEATHESEPMEIEPSIEETPPKKVNEPSPHQVVIPARVEEKNKVSHRTRPLNNGELYFEPHRNAIEPHRNTIEPRRNTFESRRNTFEPHRRPFFRRGGDRGFRFNRGPRRPFAPFHNRRFYNPHRF